MSIERLKITKAASSKKGEQLNAEILQLIERCNGRVICKALNNRPVFLTKYLEATRGRRDQTRRKQVFSVCIELMRRASTENVNSNQHGIEIRGLIENGDKIGVHIREETDSHGNKRLFLISTFRGSANE
jgi:hypothetical protein